MERGAKPKHSLQVERLSAGLAKAAVRLGVELKNAANDLVAVTSNVLQNAAVWRRSALSTRIVSQRNRRTLDE